MESDHLPVLTSTNGALAVPVTAVRSRWKTTQASWTNYNRNLSDYSLPQNSLLEEAIMSLQGAMLEAGSRSFCLSRSFSHSHPQIPWWNEECLRAVKARRTAWARWWHQPSQTQQLAYRRADTLCWRTLLQAKCASWALFCSSLSFRTSARQAWVSSTLCWDHVL